jgi:hypothetical protein
MTRKKLVQLISIVLLSLGVVLLIPGTDWHNKASTLAFGSILLGTLGSIISLFIPTTYTYYFTPKERIAEGERSKILIIKASLLGPVMPAHVLVNRRAVLDTPF